jgi:hypothetical protein
MVEHKASNLTAQSSSSSNAQSDRSLSQNIAGCTCTRQRRTNFTALFVVKLDNELSSRAQLWLRCAEPELIEWTMNES